MTLPAAKLRYIDALRGLAIFLVLIVHTAQPYNHIARDDRAHAIAGDEPANKIKKADQPGPNFAGYTRAGEFGVSLFFLVSALTFFLSLDRRKVDERHPVLNFFIRRVARVGPLFWCAIIFFLGSSWIFNIVGDIDHPNVHGSLLWLVKTCLRYGFDANTGSNWLGADGQLTWRGIIATVFFVNGWNPYWVQAIVWGGWSVAVETMFYMFVPMLFRLIRSIDAAMLFFLLAIVIAVTFDQQVRHAHVIPERELWHDASGFMLPYQLPNFAAGIVCFFLLNKGLLAAKPGNNEASARKARRTNLFRSLLFLGGFAYLYWALPYSDCRLMPPPVTYSFAFMLLTLALGLYDLPILVNGFFRYLGKISYSVYLTHAVILCPIVVIVGEFVKKHHLHLHPPQYWLVTLFLTTTASMAVSTLTFRLIEQPGQRLGKKLIDYLEQRAIAKAGRVETVATSV